MKTIHENVSKQNLKDISNDRAQIELLRSRLDLLDGKEKLMMTLYLEDGYSICKISQVADLCRTSIARRIKRLKKNLLEGKYITCIQNCDKFNRDQMAIAKDYFLRGLSIRQITKKRHRSVYHVRETIIQIKSILNECGSTDTK